jgi:hypothetical protein
VSGSEAYAILYISTFSSNARNIMLVPKLAMMVTFSSPHKFMRGNITYRKFEECYGVAFVVRGF